MLTPATDDPNRKEELKRKAREPKAFGVPRLDTNELSGRHLTGHKLVTDQGLAAPEEPAAVETDEERIAREEAEAATREAWKDYLDQPVGVLIDELPNVQDVEQLTEMRDVEVSVKNRKTLIEAIVTEIAKRNEQGE